ncbi:Hypothetical protein DHA2_152067, partial [Giardia duodenalis]
VTNYTLLIDMDSPHDYYESFDKQVGEALAGISGSSLEKYIESSYTEEYWCFGVHHHKQPHILDIDEMSS